VLYNLHNIAMFFPPQDFRKRAQAEAADSRLDTHRGLYGARSVRYRVLIPAEEVAWRRKVTLSNK